MAFWKKDVAINSLQGIETSVGQPPQIPRASVADTSPSSMEKALSEPDSFFRPRMPVEKRIGELFGDVVNLLMNVLQYRKVSLNDLEWLVKPPLQHGQFVLATAPERNRRAGRCLGAVLWAEVSPELDQNFASCTGGLIRIAPRDRKSGTAVWVMVAAGEVAIIRSLLKRLHSSELANRTIKLWARTPAGEPIVATIGQQAFPN